MVLVAVPTGSQSDKEVDRIHQESKKFGDWLQERPVLVERLFNSLTVVPPLWFGKAVPTLRLTFANVEHMYVSMKESGCD